MAQNLTQAKRPRKFKEVIGHVKVVNELIKRSKDSNFPQVILLEGLTGTGKTTLARIIAMSANCSNLKEGEPCGECPSCKDIQSEKFNRGTILEYDARDIKVEEIEIIRSFLSGGSLIGDPIKICFIDELQGMWSQGASVSARDKLLKLLEKVYKDVIFILGTMDGSAIPKALRNRTIFYKLNPLSSEELVTNLFTIASEYVSITEEKANVLLAIAQNAQGSMRTALSYLERCIYGDIWTVNELSRELDLVSNETVLDYVYQLVHGKSEILDTYLSSDILSSIEETVVLILKKQMGATLRQDELKKIGQLFKEDKSKYMTILNEIQETKKYGYVTSSMITLMLVKLIDRLSRPVKMNETKEEVVEEKQPVKRVVRKSV